MPVPLVEALELPGLVERATMQRPHAEYGYAPRDDARATPHGRIYISAKASTVAAFLTNPMKFSRFQRVKKSVE